MVGSCAEKMRLFVVWHSAMETYSRAVAEQSQRIGIVPKAEYERLLRAAESAREHVLEAREILDVHVKGHGCGGAGEAAA
jgi:hypothetical protein